MLVDFDSLNMDFITKIKTQNGKEYLLNESYLDKQLKNIFNVAVQYCVAQQDILEIKIIWRNNQSKHTIGIGWDVQFPDGDKDLRKLHDLWTGRIHDFVMALDNKGYKLFCDVGHLNAYISVD